MSESLEQNIVSLLEEHVELAISTIQKLREEKLAFEAEVARLNSDVLQRDAQIQELETRNSELRAASEQARLATEAERAEIRHQLEDLMAVLAESKTAVDDAENEIAFTVESTAPDSEV